MYLRGMTDEGQTFDESGNCALESYGKYVESPSDGAFVSLATERARWSDGLFGLIQQKQDSFCAFLSVSLTTELI